MFSCLEKSDAASLCHRGGSSLCLGAGCLPQPLGLDFNLDIDLDIEIAWLSLCFILERSWVALYSDVCQCVCQASVSPDQISTFSNIYRHTSPMLTLYHVIPSSASFYWPSTTKYQTVSPYTDPVPAGTTYNSSFRKAQLNNFSFYDSFDESRTVYLV